MTESSGGAVGSDGGDRRRRTDRSRYVVVALLLLGGIITFGSSAFLSSAAIDATARSFTRSKVPGAITMDLHPGTWNVWLEGPGRIDGVSVTDPSGRAIDVHMHGGGTSYALGGFEASTVASFEIPRAGMITGARVAVTGSADDPEATFAVGPADDFRSIDVARYATVAVLAIDLLSIALIVVVPIVRSRRRD